MKRLFCLPVYILFLGVCAATARADLTANIRSLLGDKVLSKDQVGVVVVYLGNAEGSDRQIFEYKSTTPRIPASNLKLITTAAAINQLGAGFQFKTTLAARGPDIAIIGDGDPTLGDAELLKKLGWGTDTVFKAWAEMLRQRGIVHVRDVYVDDSIFEQNFAHPNWSADQAHKRYQAQVAGLNFNANCLDFYLRTTGQNQVVDFRVDPPTHFAAIANDCITGGRNAVWLSRQLGSNSIVLRGETNVSNDVPVSVTIDDPPMFAGTFFAETLEANGISVTGKVERDRTIRAAIASKGPATNPAGAWVPAAIHTTPLSTVLARANKDSMNLYAESMCKRVGASTTGQPGSWENGTAAVGDMLKKLGIPSTEFNLDDGCGLSKKNNISPNAVVRVLEHQFHSKDWPVYLASLSVGGMDGTLENRFRDSDLKGRVFGKSGYVAGVRSLSGYVKTRDSQWFAFSILMNNLGEGEAQAKVIQERIVQAVDADSAHK
ncbi:MAG TPA: D-alanyl-D-alanine carboxypeptidase/D-alanyl-D-alanine-endopeptidase [Tepidisphaeraceae bacterium]|nr:D-alanyl-D-alanine carboxypeptidase/D-alanyl-D-alanine-endopeptidase [Tepidisphaeraceae bacterium]